MDEKLLEAKRELYSLLLKKDVDTLTENEVDIMFHLAKDKQIQELFKKNS